MLSHTLMGSCAFMDIRTSQAMHHLKTLWTLCSSHLTCRRADSSLTWLLILKSPHSSYILVCGKCLHGGSRNSILSTPTSMSSPSTCMTPGETCLIKSWNENKDGSCKVFFHVPHFVDLHLAARKLLQLCLYISAISTPKTGYCEKVNPHNPSHHDWSTY